MKDKASYLYEKHKISMLKYTYCELADLCCSPNSLPAIEKITGLFVENSVLEVPVEYGGKHSGLDEIRKFWAKQTEIFRFGEHIIFHDRIEITGELARGMWKNLFVVLPLKDNQNQVLWILGHYDDEYIKIGSEWRFKSVKVSIRHVFSKPF